MEQSNTPAPKPREGLICEDCNTLEVTDTRTGQPKIIKTNDRQRAAQGMCEANGPIVPTHNSPEPRPAA